jgi:putative drug exporter of the RND superfamily
VRRLTNWSARHPWRVLAAWGVAVLVGLALTVAFIGDLTTEGEVTNNPESEQAYQLIDSRIPYRPDEQVSELIDVRSGTVTSQNPEFWRKVTDLSDAVRKEGAVVVHDATDRPQAGLVSKDGHAALITVGLIRDPEADVEAVIDEVERADRGPFEVTITGEWTVDRDLNQLSQDDLRAGELEFGLPVALIVLLLVFGAVVAGLVPVLMALVSIVVALGVTVLIGQLFELSIFTVNMLSGMGLALGIDYSLFVISRYREERAHGREQLAAIDVVAATANRAVVFSGIAFVLAMVGMVLVPDTILRSLAMGAILVGIVSVLAAMTLLPALLGLIGDRINALRIPLLGRSAEAGSAGEGRFWTAVVRGVMSRPLMTAVLSVCLLLALAAPVFSLKIGFVGLKTVPDRFVSKQGFNALVRDFGVGTVDDMQVVVDGKVSSPEVLRSIARVRSRIASDPAFRRPETEVLPEKRIAVVSALPSGDSRDERVYDAVLRVRDTYVPEAFEDSDAHVLVTGETAEGLDYFALVRHWLPIVFAFVLGLSFVLLTIAFRSIVVPLKAIVLNLLSVGAAYGLLVLVFQKGVGNEVFGFQQVDTIEAWVPLFLFSVLFGLSMDYHVFLLSRIRERYVRTGDNEDSVAHGVASTARIITGAALIIIAVFSGFARGDLIMFQQMGFGVAVSLLIDATLIRTVLLPASMKLLGDANWYLPSWLGWLPDLRVEHE